MDGTPGWAVTALFPLRALLFARRSRRQCREPAWSTACRPRDAPSSPRPHRDLDRLRSAPTRDDHEALVERGLEIHIDSRLVEKALNLRIVERLDPEDVRAGPEAGDDELACLLEREIADEMAGARIVGDDVRAEDAIAVLRDAPLHTASLLSEAAVRIDVGDTRDVIRKEAPPFDVARGERDGKHHGACAEHAPAAAGPGLRFSERGMRESDKVPGLVKRNRFQIEPARLPVLGHAPRDAAVEEHVRFQNLARTGIDEEAGGRENAVEVGPGQDPQRAGVVVVERLGAGEPAELKSHRGGRHVFPGAKRALDRLAELLGRDAWDATVGDRVARGLRGPPEAHGTHRVAKAELQVRLGRSAADGDDHACQQDEDASTRRATAAPHRALPSRTGTPSRVGTPRPASTLTRASALNTRSASRSRSGWRVTPEAFSPAVRETPGITTFTPAAFCATRNTPWFSPLIHGTAGPCASRNTTTSSPSRNVGAPTTTRRYGPICPPGTLNVTSPPRSPFRYSSARTVTSVSISRWPSAQRGSVTTTRPWTIARAPVTSSSRLAGRISVASSPAPATVQAASIATNRSLLMIDSPPRREPFRRRP